MWKRLWREWTIDRPAAAGDRLWQVLVVELAAWLDRLTLRQIIAFIPVVILIGAYYHRIPIPPELMLLGDVLAYLDIFSVFLLIGLLSRVSAVWFFIKQTAALVADLVFGLMLMVRRRDVRHRRERASPPVQRQSRRGRDDGDDWAFGGAVFA